MIKAITKYRIPLLIVLVMLGPMNFNMFLPALPLMRADFNTTTSVTQAFVSVGMAFFAIGTFIYGFVSDRIGRKPSLISGLVLYIVGNIICTIGGSLAFFFIGRSITTFGGAGIAVSVRASISDVYGMDKSRNVYGWIAVSMIFVPLLAPTLGGYITEFGSWNWTFGFMCLLGIISFIPAVFLIPETINKKEKIAERHTKLINDLRKVIFSKQWWTYAMLCACLTAISHAFTSGMPYVAEEHFHLSPKEYGTWLILAAFGYFIGSLVSVKISTGRSIAFMTIMGSLLVVIFSIAMLITYLFNPENVFLIFLTMSILSFGAALAVPSSMSAAINIKGIPKGAATSMQGVTQTGIPIIAVQFVGIAYNNTAIPIIGSIIFLAVLSLLISIKGRKLNL